MSIEWYNSCIDCITCSYTKVLLNTDKFDEYILCCFCGCSALHRQNQHKISEKKTIHRFYIQHTHWWYTFLHNLLYRCEKSIHFFTERQAICACLSIGVTFASIAPIFCIQKCFQTQTSSTDIFYVDFAGSVVCKGFNSTEYGWINKKSKIPQYWITIIM